MFTQNQIRQFLPVSAYQSSDMAGGSTNIGKVRVTATPYGEYNVQYVDSTGKVISFIIPAKSILWKRATSSAKMQYKSKATLVTLNPAYLVDTNNDSTVDSVISGQDYMLNIRINSLYWDSDEVWGHKYGVVHATYGMSSSDFYKKLALSLVANFSRDEKPLLKFFLLNTEFAEYSLTGSYSDGSTVSYNGKYYEATAEPSGNPETDTTNWTEVSLFAQTTPGTYDYVVEVNSLTSPDSLSSTYYGVIIDEADEADRPWRLGVQPMQDIEYIASPSTVIYSGEEVNWGNTEKLEGSVTIGNGRKVADMEYFYHANRGDYNREAAWPNNWPSVNQINPSSTYDIIDIHWSWEGNNHAIQRSEKDLTLAFSDASSHDAIGDFLSDWNTLNIGANFSDTDFNPSPILN